MEAPSLHATDRTIMRAPVKTGADDRTGYTIARGEVMSSPTTIILIRQRVTRSAAGPREAFFVPRGPNVELGRSRDQRYCSSSRPARLGPGNDINRQTDF